MQLYAHIKRQLENTYTGGESSAKSGPLILSDGDVRWTPDFEEAEAQLVGVKAL